MVFHVGIGFTALVIMVAFDAANHAPWGFYVCEGVIVFGCAAVTGRFPALQDFGRTVLGPPGERPKRRRRKARRRAGKESEVKLAERIAGIALIGAFFVQFAALVFLLWETGGPIDSPFAELTLAIAVFTPFLANDPKTVLFVVLVTIVYYAVLTLVFSETHDGSSVSTSPWAYFAVNVTILLGAIIFTMIESVARRVQSGIADLVDPPDEQEHGIDPTVPAET